MMNDLSPDLETLFKKVRLLALDVDGVLTDGGVYILEDGQEFRRFDIKDGAGLKAVQQAGIPVIVISSGACRSIHHRCQRLGITEVHTQVVEKLPLLQTICHKYEVRLEEVCYVGDDLVDLAIMSAVGVACAPADAIAPIQAIATYITRRPGGYGAVRELCDLLLGMQNKQ